MSQELTRLLVQRLGGEASLELLSFMTLGTSAIVYLAPGLSLVGFIQFCSPLGTQVFLLLNCPKGFILAYMDE